VVAGFEGLALPGFGQRSAGAGEVVGGPGCGGDVDGVVDGSRCLAGGEFPDVWYHCLHERSALGGVVEVGQVGFVVVGDVGQVVVVGDVAVGVVGAARGGIGGEPVLGAGGVDRGWVGGVPGGEGGLGPVGVGAGDRGVDEVVGVGVVDLGELLDLGIEEVSERGRFGRFLLQPAAGVGVGGGVGFGGAEAGGVVVSGRGLPSSG
jgi:hypothetical protein